MKRVFSFKSKNTNRLRKLSFDLIDLHGMIFLLDKKRDPEGLKILKCRVFAKWWSRKEWDKVTKHDVVVVEKGQGEMILLVVNDEHIRSPADPHHMPSEASRHSAKPSWMRPGHRKQEPFWLTIKNTKKLCQLRYCLSSLLQCLVIQKECKTMPMGPERATYNVSYTYNDFVGS